jgi:predicted nucleic acid-binding protein
LIVVDASLVIALILREDNVNEAASVYGALQIDLLIVPAHWPAEIANALWANQQRDRIPPGKIDVILEDVFSFKPIIDAPPSGERIASLIQFAETEKLTVYDAIYVQLALTRDASLATIDTDMRACARRLNIPLLPG